MTAVHEPIPAASIPAITYRQAVDLIVAAADDLLLPFPYGIEAIPGSGILAVSFWTDLDVQSWSDFFGASVWDGTRTTVIVHAHDWHGWTVQMTGQGMRADEPTVYLPVFKPTGVQVNRAEAARLSADVRPCTVCGTPSEDWCIVCTAPLCGEHHCDHDAPVLATREQRLAHYGDVLTVDPDLTADRGNAEVARLVAPQTSFAEALPRLQAQRDDAAFAEIVAEVHGV